MVIMAITVIIIRILITKTIRLQIIITGAGVIVLTRIRNQLITKITTIIRITIGGTTTLIPIQATMAALILVLENGGTVALPLREAAALVVEEILVVLVDQHQAILAEAQEEDNL